MLPLEKIICSTDFSDSSFEGLKAANELAANFGAKVILLHAIAPMPTIAGAGAPTGFHIPPVLKEMEGKAAEELERLKAEKLEGGIDARTMVIYGKPADEIVRIAEEEKADLIVIATHGQSGWKRFISGSVTERVVRMASCPVLVVPAQPED
jgi:nucleotide-binding universal stress UspA family protein